MFPVGLQGRRAVADILIENVGLKLLSVIQIHKAIDAHHVLHDVGNQKEGFAFER